MSVINQVLSDLERRGETAPRQQLMGAIPVRPERDFRVIWIALLVCALAGGGWVWQQRSRAPVPELVTVPPPALVSTLPIPSSAVPQAGIVEPVVVQQEVAQLLAASDVVAVSSVEAQAAVTPPPVRVRSTATAREQSVPVQKIVKSPEPRQLAEDAFRNAGQLARSGQTKEAIEGYTLALSIDPSHAPAREALAATLLGRGQPAEAERVLQEGLALDQKQARFAMLAARLQVEREALPVALATLEKSLPYAEHLPEYHAFIAALLQRQDRHKEAVLHYQVALQRSPDSGVWLMGAAISLQALGHKGEAQEAYGRALASNSLGPELQAFVLRQLAGMK